MKSLIAKHDSELCIMRDLIGRKTLDLFSFVLWVSVSLFFVVFAASWIALLALIVCEIVMLRDVNKLRTLQP